MRPTSAFSEVHRLAGPLTRDRTVKIVGVARHAPEFGTAALALIAATLNPALDLSASFVLYRVSFQLLFESIGRSKEHREVPGPPRDGVVLEN